MNKPQTTASASAPTSKEDFEATILIFQNKLLDAVHLLHETKTMDELHGLLVMSWMRCQEGITGAGSLTANFVVEAFLRVTVQHPLDTDPEIKALRMANILEEKALRCREECTYADFVKDARYDA